MKINNTMTAEEFLDNYLEENDHIQIGEDVEDIYNIMIEFAQYHVKQCLLEASNKAYCYFENDDEPYESNYIVSKESILNSYPDDRIK